PGEPGQFPGGERPVVQQGGKHRGAGRLGQQRGGRHDVHVAGGVVGTCTHTSTLAQQSFGHDRSMSEDSVCLDPATPPKAVDVADYVRESPDKSGNPGQLVVDGVEACLALARTWHAWDGGPIARTVDGKPNTWLPYKALRRITDHLIDHLHQVE